MREGLSFYHGDVNKLEKNNYGDEICKNDWVIKKCQRKETLESQSASVFPASSQVLLFDMDGWIGNYAPSVCSK